MAPTKPLEPNGSKGVSDGAKFSDHDRVNRTAMRSTAAAVVSMLLLALGSFADASAIPSTFTLNGLKYVVTAANTVTVGTETTTACDPSARSMAAGR